MEMKILFIASECAPFAKVGGLADVIGALPDALNNLGAEASVVIPYYGVIDRPTTFVSTLRVEFGDILESFDLFKIDDSCVYLIKNEKYFGHNIYFEKDATPGKSEQEAESFLFLSVSSLQVAEFLKADILHCNDWHTGIIPLISKNRFKTILTIHNLAYQSVYHHELVNRLLKTEFKKDINCLKEGILNADLITTVSPTYATEVLTKKFGAGLERFLRKRKKDLFGILNGIDIEEFDPNIDSSLVSNYDLNSIEKRKENKRFLQETCFGKYNPEIPLSGIVSRLTSQKGLDLITKAFDKIVKEDIQMIVLGQGTKQYEEFFSEKAKQFPQKVFARIGFDDAFARKIYAGTDLFLMPSLFEPCGLGQQIAMRYGSIPLVRATGGLKDTVTESTGFLFKRYNSNAFLNALKRSLKAFNNKERWAKMQMMGMQQDFSWSASAKKYLSLYRKLNEKE